jgi:hypothetical protein
MTVKRDVRKAFRRLLVSRTGTAEIIGSVMFLLIMMFFFTNVFLWHDNATRQMDGVLSEKMNSVVSIQAVNLNVTEGLTLSVTNNGGVGADLSRLWIITGLGSGQESHKYVNLTGRVVAGIPFPIKVDKGDVILNETNVFKIVTTLGNMATCSGVPYDNT